MGRSFSDRDAMILLIYYHVVPIAMTSLVFLLLLVNRLFAAFCAPQSFDGRSFSLVLWGVIFKEKRESEENKTIIIWPLLPDSRLDQHTRIVCLTCVCTSHPNNSL